MADKRFRGRDKIVQKMTKDGLVEENLRTGETKSAVEEEPPKQEDSEKDAAESAEETPVVEEDVCMDAEDGEEEKPRRSSASQSRFFSRWSGTRPRSLRSRKALICPALSGRVSRASSHSSRGTPFS